jgi:hypothetical protein
MNETRRDLLERYIRTAWIMKIRLMSARRQLWANQCSLIHIETSALQMRKICECVVRLCMLLAEVEFENVPKKSRKDYEPGKIFKFLSNQNKMIFPQLAKLSKNENDNDSAQWRLEQYPIDPNDSTRVARIWNEIGKGMHEFSPYDDYPASEAPAKSELGILLNSFRADHQWLWNRFWQHAVQLQEGLFFVNLGSEILASQPFVIKTATLLEKELAVQFDPEFVSDFVGEINWADFAQ